MDITTLQTAVQKSLPLQSVFDRVSLSEDGRKLPSPRSKLSPSILSADGLANQFPPLQTAVLEADLDRLNRFVQGKALEETLPFLYQKYGWRIASEQMEDAAFCDVARMDAALQNDSEGKYWLVKGDLTGIQEYIYGNIQAGRTGGLSQLSKRLRVRSVLVTLLTDFLANIILKELNLGPAHLLFAGGGHFNLLLPGDEQTRLKLETLAAQLDEAMLSQFGDRLELVIAYVPCSSEIKKNAGPVFEAVNAERDRRKYQRHRNSLKKLFFRKIERETAAEKETEARLGGLFPKQSYLLEIQSSQELRSHNGDLVLAVIQTGANTFHTLLAVDALAGKDGSAESFLLRNSSNGLQSVGVFRLNDTDFLPEDNWAAAHPGLSISYGFRLIGKSTPFKKDATDVLDFEGIAKIGEEDVAKGEGFQRLGAMMLDVDNLGMTFSHGLGSEAPLARILTLSRELNYFFSAHFNTRAEQYQIYIVYSGGDDAFVIGKWDKLIRFSNKIWKDFRAFTCYDQNKNPDVHFSAGIFMSNPHYPLGRFYKDTKRLQDKAKVQKNQVDVFDHTLDWNNFDAKIELGDQFLEVLHKGETASGRKFSASFAYRIMQLVKTSYFERDGFHEGMYVKRGGMRMDKFARNVANMRYLFARNNFSEADIEKLTSDLEMELTKSFLRETFSFGSKRNARDYLVALNFAMLQLRSKKEKNTNNNG